MADTIEQKNAGSTSRLESQAWYEQKSSQLLSDGERVIVSHAPRSTRRSRDLLQLVLVLLRAAFLYPAASLRALGFFLGFKKLNDISEVYEPKNLSLRTIFEIFESARFPDEGSLILPNEEAYDDFMILSHVFAKNIAERLNEGDNMLTKIRWGLAHGLFNAQVHGDPGHEIYLRWKVTDEECRLQLTNAKNEERMKPHNVSINGIPISGVGGSLVTMRLLFDYFDLSEIRNAKEEEEIRLILIDRRKRKNVSLRHFMALRVAQARDNIQLERIMRI